MSDLGGGDNGRGPSRVPVLQASSSGGLITPRDIMKNREAREARRKAEADSLTRAQEEERRRSAERRSLATGVSGPTRGDGGQRRSGVGAAVAAESIPQAQGEPYTSKAAPRNSQSQQQAPAVRRAPEDMSRYEPTSRPRAQSRSQEDPLTTAGVEQGSSMRRSQPTSSGLRQSSAPASTTQAAAGTTSIPTREGTSNTRTTRDNASSFPHAFERWEQLSSHWEGLTSYWLHKLESNQEELGRNIPSASAMSRQITDLSAAGANLFHAVVELQRLRASSERKFQRWFFETRAEQERTAEQQAKAESILANERAARAEVAEERLQHEQIRRNAERMVNEMRRELRISNEEAKRAWEELGRREQEERDRTTSLREGLLTVVGGVQVVPMHAGAGLSRQGSESQQPSTRNGGQYQSSRGAAESRQDPYAEEEGYYEEHPSPTDTDPFTQTSQVAPAIHHEPDVQSLAAGTYQPYPLGSTPATSGSTAQTAIPPSQQRSMTQPAVARQPTRAAPVPGTSEGQSSVAQAQPAVRAPATVGPMAPQERIRFYQHGPTEAYLRSPSTEGEDPIPLTAPQQAARDLRSEGSYVSSISNDETEYEIDEVGNLRRDAQGRPLVYRHAGATRRRMNTRSEESDDYDVEADVTRERELAARYGVSSSSTGTRAVPATSAEAMTGYATAGEPAAQTVAGAQQSAEPVYSYVPASAPTGPSAATVASSSAPDYEGQGYSVAGWETMPTRHHHPTRLSDVMEEDDETRSRISAGR